jgi:hypothetical protein
LFSPRFQWNQANTAWTLRTGITHVFVYSKDSFRTTTLIAQSRVA